MSFLKRSVTSRHSDSDDEEDDGIDPELRLRTVRTAASALEVSMRTEAKTERRKSRRRRGLFGRSNSEKKRARSSDTTSNNNTPSTEIPGVRRNVYVNHPLSHSELDQNGEPIVMYERNKVRTTKYTIVTFIPKNLFEQFLFPVFGAASGAISVLPLAFIIFVTALKDAIEDYRRSTLDEQVNTSAVTRIGGSWHNVNLAKDPRSWLDKLLGVPAPGQLTKGVRKLREREASEAGAVMRTTLNRTNTGMGSMSNYVQSQHSHSTSSATWERTLWKKLEAGDIVLLRDNEQVPADATKNLDGETNLKPRSSVKATMGITSEEDIKRCSFYLDSEPPHQSLYLYHGVLRCKDPAAGERKQESVSINELLLRGCAIRNAAWIVGLVVFTGADTKIMLNGGDTPTKRSKIERETNFNVHHQFPYPSNHCRVFEIDVDAADSHVLNALVTFVYVPSSSPTPFHSSLYRSCLIAFQNIDIDMYYQPYDTPASPKPGTSQTTSAKSNTSSPTRPVPSPRNVMEFQKCSVHGVIYGEGVTEAQRGAATRDGNTDMLNSEELNEKLSSLKQQMLNAMERSFKNRYLQPEKLTLVSPKGHLVAFFRALAVCHSVLADKPEPDRDPYRLEYKAEDVGFPFINKGKDGMDIEVMGQKERYTILKMLEFNSTRKRMSVVVRNPDGKLVLYTKGADSVIYERLAKDHDPYLKEQTSKDMEAPLEEEEYLNWSRTYDAATNAIENRDEEIDKANELIEHSLQILGGVPEAIETLHRAGIKLWILTGDKLQTAIEIGYSCNLLKQEMDVMILSAETAEKARAQIEAGLNKIASVLGPPSWDPRKRGFMPDTLRHALTPELKPLFLNLGTQCETVVCCRVSRKDAMPMTLSIGDGANDVAMIQEANIGCGLFGLEGSQAAMSADYAFGQFRFLTKLLLVHGRWSYQRVADMHSNFFYKNVIWTFVMFWFLPFNNFDATYLYQYTFILLYNLVFTSLPVIVMGAFDQDINAKAALAFPQLYVRGIRGLEYTRANIESLSDFGTTASVAAILAANTYVGINTNYWTVITWIVVFGSTIVMLLWITVYSFFFSADFIDEVIILFGELTFWTTVIFSAAVALAPRYIVKFINSSYYPLDKDIVREIKKELSLSALEAAPMFDKDHNRSASDPGTHTPMGRQTYLDTPPLDGIAEEMTPAQYAYARSRSRADDLAPPSAPGDGPSRASYYSASEIPPPSPLPSPKYKYADGTVTSTPPSRRSSVVTMRTIPQTPNVPLPSHPPQPRSPPHSLSLPGAVGELTRRLSGGGSHPPPTSPGSFEMRVRSPPLGSPSDFSHAQSRSASAASYATAH
ncbi:phospholipid-translocating P-type ATPase [Gymnopus androsaceus JB14]|uniref:Phospholipid-transporting ATPase n=1 Tax=Gymnopus androsaceus JB14 TaxID=1447944 RepID=A0A6A4H852_9AGAR|nr:phospholipid-translocating P-type ATPase [Gymnopus androsaceus JB14]